MTNQHLLGLHLEAKTNTGKPINIGDQLKLIVAKQDNSVVLQVLQQNSAKVIHEIKQQLLRESMPKQASMKKMTAVLNQISNNVREVIKFLPTPIEQQFKKLIEQLPVKSNLNNGNGLKAAIKDSGILLESKLLAEVINKNNTSTLLKNAGKTTRQATTQTSNQTQHQAIAKDLKTNLLQLSDVIKKYKQSTNSQNNTFNKQQITPFFETATKTTSRTENTAKVIDLALKVDTETIGKQVESSIARYRSKSIKSYCN